MSRLLEADGGVLMVRAFLLRRRHATHRERAASRPGRSPHMMDVLSRATAFMPTRPTPRPTDRGWDLEPDQERVPGGTHPDHTRHVALGSVGRDSTAMVLLPLRLFVGVIWLRAAAEKVIDPTWWNGTAVETFVTTQLATDSVAAHWCVWLAETVLLPNAPAVGWIVVVLETLAGLAILLGVATASFLVVGITMNVSFLLMGAVNPSAFYIPIQAILLMGDAGSVAGLDWALALDRTCTPRRWHEAVFAQSRVWQVGAGVLIIVAGVCTLQVHSFTPTALVHDPLAVLALVSAIGALGAWIQAVESGADHRRHSSAPGTTPVHAAHSVGRRPTPERPPPVRQHSAAGASARATDPTPRRATHSGTRPADHTALGEIAADILLRPRWRNPMSRTSRHARGHSPSHSRRITDRPPENAAVRNYLRSLRAPGALQDRDAITEVRTTIDRTDDVLARIRLRQRLLDLEQPSLQPYEDAFVEHAKAWADTAEVSGEAFAAEGVPVAVLRRAGFRGVTNDRPRRARNFRRGATRRATRTPTTVSSDEVRAAIPSGTFTVKDLQQRSGASATTVRRVLAEEVEAGNLANMGVSRDHMGRGRAPTTYQRT